VPVRLDSLPSRALPGGLRVLEAATHATRLFGLARLDEIPPDVALHITPCRSVHTFGMRFALDLVWLDRAGAVVRVDLDVPPRRFRTCWAARSVLEARVGSGEAFASTGRALSPDRPR
jgi:uncharacterized protein